MFWLFAEKNAKNLVVSILKKLGSFEFQLFWGDDTIGAGQVFWMTSLGPEKKKEQFLLKLAKICIFRALDWLSRQGILWNGM